MFAYRKIVVLFLLSISLLGFAQQEYSSGQLSRLQEILVQQKLPLNCKEYRIARTGYPVMTMSATAKDSVLIQGGLDLFLEDTVGECPAVVCDFIERYFLLLLLQTDEDGRFELLESNQVQLKINGKTFGKETRRFELAMQILASNPVFSLSADTASYHAVWLSLDQRMDFVFQKQYDLILGYDKKELIQQIGERLEECDVQSVGHTDFHLLDLKKTSLRNVFFSDNGTFLIPQMKAGAYVWKKDGRWDYFYDVRFPDETLLNLFSHAHLMGKEVNMHIRVDSYGTSWSNYLPISQLTSFMYKEGCVPFVGIETMTEKEITGLVLYLNRDLMYEHMLYFRIPTEFLSDGQSVVEAVLYPYIPLHNLTDLFHQELEAPIWSNP